MSSDHENSQNQSDPGTNPEVIGEASSSSSSLPLVKGWEVIDQGPLASTSGRSKNTATLPKAKVDKEKSELGMPAMKSSLGQRDAPAVQRLDKELKRSDTEASMVHSKIREEDLEDIRLSYDIPTLMTLRAPGLEERASDLPEGFVSIMN
ncbi:hypothetical protein Adt_35137 [Abeliophyllum distichum]|uniref:Uncharacterized protein n=1 Tax=Abeliophyllum distichum TaxID=126358 RepID=A0ABD1QHV6_9LAMI